MSMGSEVTLAQMVREFPTRTGLYTVGPPLFALLQVINFYLHDVPLLFAVGLAVVMVVYSVLITTYHFAMFRRTKLTAASTDARNRM